MAVDRFDQGRADTVASAPSRPETRAPRVVANEIPRILRFIERPELARELGLCEDLLADPEGRVAIDVWYGFVEAAVKVSGDPFLGARFGVRIGKYFRDTAGAVGLMLLSSDTLRVAVDRLTRYQRWWNEGERYEVEERRGRLTIRYLPWGPFRPAHVQVAEKVAGQLLFGARFANGGSLDARVHFAHPARPGSGEVGRLLACEPLFGSPSNEIVLPSAVLDAKLPTADAALFRVLDRHLAERIRNTTPESLFADQVRSAVSDYLHRERLTIGTIAKIVRCSERTLQRRLRAEGTTFRELVDEVRNSRAVALLQRGASIAEICLLLGYAEETTFYRAFKRWTGATPESWKASFGNAV